MPTTPTPAKSNFWGDMGGVPTVNPTVNQPAAVPSIQSSSPKSSAKAMVFNVGEGLSPTQTTKANQTIKAITTPSLQKNSFWDDPATGIADAFKYEFSPRDTAVPVRRAFEINPIQTKAPPIVTQGAELGYRLLEAVPKAAAILGGEFAAGFQPKDVKATIDLRRLGFETPNYVTASKQFTEAVNNGDNPFLAGLNIVSDKTLDLAFGASILSDAAKMSTRILLSGGPEARIEAQNIVDAYKTNQKTAFERLRNAPLDVRERTMAEISNTKSEAEKVLAEKGSPTSVDYARVNAARYTDVLARQTPVTKSFWSDFGKPDVSLKTPQYNTPILDAKQLPGTRERPGQAPAVGLSAREVESVGKLEGVNPNQTETLKPNEIIPVATKAADTHFSTVIGPSIKAGEGAYVNADTLKDYFGKDYNEKNHPVYSEAAFQEYERALKENPNPDVVFTGGGPASGKTEILIKNLRDSGFKGTVYDSNMSGYEGAVKQIDMARAAGKNIQIRGIIPNLEQAKIFSLVRELETGRGISDQTFAKGHAGFPYVIARLLEEGKISPNELHLFDTRTASSIQDALDIVHNNGRLQNPLDELKKLGYTENTLKANFENSNERFKQSAAGIKRGREQDRVRQGLDTTPRNAGSDQGQSYGRGNREALLGNKTKAELVNDAAERAKNGEVFGMRPERDPANYSPKVMRLNKEALQKLEKSPVAKKAYEDFLSQAAETKKAIGLPQQSQKELSGTSLDLPAFFDETTSPTLDRIQVDSKDSSPKSISEVVDNVQPPETRGGITPPKLDFTRWKDGGTLAMNRETLERNIEKIAGDQAPQVKNFIVDPIRKNETERTLFVNKMRSDIRQKVVKELGIKAKSEASAFVQKYGERQLGTVAKDGTVDEKSNLEGLQYQRPGDWYNIKEAAEYIRSQYDMLLDKVNAERLSFGYEPIPKHVDYFRHFQEISNAIQSFGVILREQDLPTEISGMTGIFKPGKPFSTAELKRRGELGSTEDAVSGMDNYLNTISKQIYHIDSVQRARALEKYIRETAKAVAQYSNIPSEQIKLQNFVANLTDYGNILAGKKSAFDRAFENLLGRRIYGFSNWVRTRVAANMIGGNISSALTNYIPFTQSLATTAKPAAIRGIAEALTSPFKDNFTSIDGVQSDFLVRRFPDEAIDLRGLKKVSDKLNWMFKVVDEFTAKSIVAGKYFENVKKGLGKEEAMKAADDYAGRVLADRSFGQLPNIFNSRSIGFFTQFQTEVNNMFSFMTKDIPNFAKDSKFKKTQIASAVAQFVLYSYLFNNAYQKITGRRPTLDPLYGGLTIMGLTSQSQDTDFLKRLWTATQDLGGNLPFTGLLIQGGRLPVSAAFPSIAAVTSGKSNWKTELEKPLAYFAPPFGGGQIKKTIEGVASDIQGSVSSASGKFQFQGPQSTGEKVRAAIFGKYSTQNAQDFFNKTTAKQQEQAPIKKIYDQVQQLKKDNKIDEAQKIVDGLSDDEYKTYKDIRTADRRANTIQAEQEMITTVKKVQDLVASGKEAEAHKIVDDMTDDEYKIYQGAKKLYSANKSAPTYQEGKKVKPTSLIHDITTYAQAIGTDPVTAFDRIFTGQKIRRVDNGSIIVERMSLGDSAKVKTTRGGNNPEMKLDHTIPLELGGSNSESNLALVPTAEWEKYTPVENYLGKQLRAGNLSKKEVQSLITRFKKGELQASDIIK